MEYRITTLQDYLVQFKIIDSEGKEHTVHSTKKGKVFYTHKITDLLICLANHRQIKIAKQINKKAVEEAPENIEPKETENVSEDKKTFEHTPESVIENVLEEAKPPAIAKRRSRRRTV